jgi:hypothetical protein
MLAFLCAAFALQGPNFPVESHARLAPSEGRLVVGGQREEWVAPFRTAMAWRELLVSWNLDVDEGAGAVVELAIEAGEERSDWLHLGEWGVAPGVRAPLESTLGTVEVDWFKARRPLSAAQVRVRAFGKPGAVVRVARLDLVASDIAARRAAASATPALDPAAWRRRLDVPFRSQRSAGAEIASRVCSPTSTSMLLAWRGVDVELERFCALAHDPVNDIYGNWPRNVQAAWTLGVPGRLARCSTWGEVEAYIAAGQPLVVSIRAKKGELAGAPYESTNGHLLVLVGFDEEGRVLVNDPATSDPARGRCTFSRADMEVVWMNRGGLSYVLMERPAAIEPRR